MASYPQEPLEVLHTTMSVLAIDTICCLPISSKGNRHALTVIFLHISYVFAVAMKERSAEKVVQPY